MLVKASAIGEKKTLAMSIGVIHPAAAEMLFRAYLDPRHLAGTSAHVRSGLRVANGV
jgi:hypothetical protein